MEVVEDQDGAVLGDRRQLGEERLDRVLAARAPGFERAQERGGRRREPGIVLATGGDEVRQEPDPVAILLVDAIPQRAEPRSTGEIRQKRGLAVARVGNHEHDPAVNPDVQPVEQARSGQRLVPKRRGLDLPGLNRIAAHVVPCIDADAIGRRDHRAARADGNRCAHFSGHSWRTDDDRIGRRER